MPSTSHQSLRNSFKRNTQHTILMGITIHYQGRLSDPKQLPNLITAIQRSCRTLDWRTIHVDEVGKTIEQPLPDWRRDWGISAGEN